MNAGWTTAEDIAARVRRRWDDGSLLRAYANGDPFDPIEVSLRGPTPSQVGDDIAAARKWVAALDAGRRDDSRYTLQWQSIGGRQIGRNQLPVRAVVSSIDQAWALLGMTDAVRRFDELLALAHEHPQVRQWIVEQPLRALELAAEMPRLIAAYVWLDSHRQIAAIPSRDQRARRRHQVRREVPTGLGCDARGPGDSCGIPCGPWA